MHERNFTITKSYICVPKSFQQHKKNGFEMFIPEVEISFSCHFDQGKHGILSFIIPGNQRNEKRFIKYANATYFPVRSLLSKSFL